MPHLLDVETEETETKEVGGNVLEVVEGREVSLIEEDDEEISEETLAQLYRESVDNMAGDDIRPEDNY